MSSEHVTYRELMELDNHITDGVFPGFYLLKRIGMISNITLAHNLNSNICRICLKTYNNFPTSKDDLFFLIQRN